ncbi:Gfo/Idh/MocA family protein [Oleiharenicola lentus]|uniref:Gfo/Idh/MocA family protein n=1 Tax=Oleiharenicola lentus TaxID=2508720 RepID=UPI003F67D4BC
MSNSLAAPLPQLTPPAVALIGLGGYGQVHLRVLRELSAAGACRFVSAVAVPGTASADLASLPADVRLYDSFAAWLAAERGRFDLCCLPTPIHLHASMTLAALAAGGSVLVEKPLAASWHEIVQVLEARPQPGRFLAVGFHDFCTAEVYRLKTDLLSGRHGKLKRIKLLGLWPRPDAYYQRNAWAGRLRVPDGAVLDSPLNNALAHYLMLALFFAGETPADAAVVVSGEAELYRTRRIESFDTAVLRLQTRHGVELLSAVTHSGSTEEVPLLVLELERGRIEWRAGKELKIISEDAQAVVAPLPDAVQARVEMFMALFARGRQEDAPICAPRLAATHAACILDLNAACPIHDIPPELLRSHDLAGEPGVGLIGIDAVLRRTIEEAKLPSELGLAWTRPATKFVATRSLELAQLA